MLLPNINEAKVVPVLKYFHREIELSSFNPGKVIAISIFITAAQTINPIKKCTKGVHKTCNTNEQVSSNNTTKQADDIGQLVTSYSCDILQTAPPSQIHTIEI